jgi:hypothetical protein
LRPETGFDLHCVAELAVQLAGFSALTVGSTLERLIYRAVRNLVTVEDIKAAQAYLMDEHMNPFTFLQEVAAA